MDKIETVALMAATIYGSIPPIQRGQPGKQGISNIRIAAQAWALFDSVEKEAAERHSRR